MNINYSFLKFFILSLIFLTTLACSEQQKGENNSELKNEKVEKKTKLKKKKKLALLKKEAEKLPIELVDGVMEHYFKLKNNLANNDNRASRANAKQIVAILIEFKDQEVSYPLTAVQETAYEISQIESIDIQREYFRPLSQNLYKIVLKTMPTKPLYLQHCPMAFDGQGADWLSLKKEIQNPYYGKGHKMFSCGSSRVGIARM